jgi:repressor LexA
MALTSFPNITPIARKSFPLFDGIAAGEPRLMPDGETLYVDATVDVQADYVLKVHGDSMIGARIDDGDYVFIRQQPEVENGEIAAVAIGDEATLKRLIRGCGQKVGLNFPHRICEKCIQKNSTIKHLKSMKKQNL